MSLVECQLPGFSILESFLSGPSYIDSPLHSMIFEQESLLAAQSEEPESALTRHYSEPAPTLLSAPNIEASRPDLKSKKRRAAEFEGEDSINPAPRGKIPRRDYKDTEFSKPRGYEPARAMSLQETQAFLHPGGKLGEPQMYPSPAVSAPTSSPGTSYTDLNALRRHSIPGTPSSSSDNLRVWHTPYTSVYSESPVTLQGEFTNWPAPCQFDQPVPPHYMSPVAVHEFEGLRHPHHKHSHSLPINSEVYPAGILGQEPLEGYPIHINPERFPTSSPHPGHHTTATSAPEYTPVRPAPRPASHSGMRKFPSSNVGSHRRFFCNEPGCDGKRSFGTQSNLTRHLKEQHSGVEHKTKFNCRFCPQTFTRKHAMQAHERKGTCRGTL